MNSKDITQLKLMVMGSALVMLISFIGTALIAYGSISVRIENLEKQDQRIIEQHNRDIDKVETVISAVISNKPS